MKRLNKTNLWLTIGIVAIIIVALIVVFSVPKEKETIKIGGILPLSGNVAFWGQPFQKGMEIAVEEINSAGGINGKKIELIIEDSGGDSTKGITALNKLLNIDNVLAVSIHTSAVALPAAPILEEKKVPWIATTADTGLPLTYNYAFKSFYNAYVECKKLVSYGSKKGMTKYGLLLPYTSWGEWCLKGVKEIVGEENVVDLRYNFKETDFKILLLIAKKENVDGLVWLGFPHESDVINKQKAELDIKIPLLCGYGYDCVSDYSLSKIPEEYLNNNIVFNFVINDNFKQKHREFSSTEIIPVAFGYDEIHIIANALEKCENIDKECLYKNLPLVKDYPSAINSKGFDNMKNLVVDTEIFEIKNKSFVKIQ